MSTLYRIAELVDWRAAQATGAFASADLADEGFIHSSELHQVLETAQRYYPGRQDLMLLEIDEVALKAAGVRVEREWVESRGEAFAHVFGPIPQAAIVRQFAFQPDSEGRFALPADL